MNIWVAAFDRLYSKNQEGTEFFYIFHIQNIHLVAESFSIPVISFDYSVHFDSPIKPIERFFNFQLSSILPLACIMNDHIVFSFLLLLKWLKPIELFFKNFYLYFSWLT